MSDNTLSKTEIISIVVRLSVLSVGTFFTLKWLFGHLDPTKTQKKHAKKKAQEQLTKIGIRGLTGLSDYEMMIASHLVDPSDISVDWSNIAGLNDTIQELKETVILPVQRKDLFAESQLTQPPKGVLLHGPPGCGKTMIAKATAREAGMRFINLDVSILTDKWYGESQKLASAVFSLAVKLQPCIIFIDEIDSFLRNRNTHDHEATAMMKAQFMSLWDGLITDSDCTVIVMGATNRPNDLDKAILRRMPARFFINLPDAAQRREILELILKEEPVSDNLDISKLARNTEGFSGSDLREMCRNASVYRIRDYIRNSTRYVPSGDTDEYSDAVRPITMNDLEVALEKMKESRVHCEM
jgi:SpoVK/Ycf46/Vps4 family AAA+-type ATPase